MVFSQTAALEFLDRLGPLASLLFNLSGTLLRLRSGLALALLGLSTSPRPPRRAGRLGGFNGVFSGRLVRVRSVTRSMDLQTTTKETYYCLIYSMLDLSSCFIIGFLS